MRRRVARPAAGSLGVIIAIANVRWSGWNLSAIIGSSIGGVISVTFAVVLGMWITRIIEQSTDRRELLAELRETQAQLAVSQHTAGALEARERMSRDIHDTLAQGFTSIAMLAQGAQAQVSTERRSELLDAIERTARDNLAEARALMDSSAPPALVGPVLTEALRRLGEKFEHETGTRVTIDVAAPADAKPERDVALLRATQEALSNIRKHADAGSVAILPRACGDGAELLVRDDGSGIAAGGTTGGRGIDGLRRRVQELGGRLAYVVDLRGHREDTPAARVRQTRGGRSHGRSDRRRGARSAGAVGVLGTDPRVERVNGH